MSEDKKFTCNTCGHEREEGMNCGGDCVYCMADLGDPDCVQRVFKETLECGGYRSIDSILVSQRIENKEKADVESTKESCDKCGASVWVSIASRASVVKAAVKDGGKYYFVCMQCVPEDIEKEVSIDPEQKAEMLAAGFDIDKVLAESGMNLQEFAQHVVAKAKSLRDLKALIDNINEGKKEGLGERGA